MKILSGIQPTGKLHIGNYIGAVKQWLNLQNEQDCFFMIVDLHAITTPYRPEELRQNVIGAALDYLALGLDPKKSNIFIQSRVKEHTELAWLLGAITPLGELERMTQFKEKSQKQKKERVSLGLFAYPVLMAADILLYKTEGVPVGDDQIQHIELTRTIARKFNKTFDYDLLKEPKPLLSKSGARVMSLQNPAEKMSKSAGEAGYVALFEDEDLIHKKFKRAVTDSGTEIRYDPKEKPAISNLLEIYGQMSEKSVEEIEKEYEGKGYGQFKSDIAEIVIEKLKPARERRKELEKNQDYVLQALKDGKEKAREKAEETMREVKKIMGLN